jgi:hypothetical protein
MPLSRAERNMTAPLTIVLLFAPTMAFVMVRTVPDPGAWPLWIPLGLGAALVGFILRGVYRNNRQGLTLRAWAAAFRSTALIQAVRGVWVLVTGRPFSKFAHASVPRSDSIYYFLLALAMWLAGIWLATAKGLHQRSGTT